jgi:hypothetical protein
MAEDRDGIVAALEKLSLEDLREVVRRGGELLAVKEKEGQQAALQEIQRIAREYGLSVDVKGHSAGKRRGRPPKVRAAAGANKGSSAKPAATAPGKGATPAAGRT